MARESEIWKWMTGQQNKRPDLYGDLDMSRVENILNRAWPDTEGSFRGVGFWLEMKVLKQTRKDGSAGSIRFEHGQREWLQQRWNRGQGAAYALIEGPGQRLFAIPGRWAPALPQEGVVTVARLEHLSVLHPAWEVRRGDPDGLLRLLVRLTDLRDVKAMMTVVERKETGLARISPSPVQALLDQMG